MRLKISRWFWPAVLAATAICPLELLASLFFASTLHEFGHMIALASYRIPVKKINFTAFGAVIDSDLLLNASYQEEIIVTLAGIAFNFFFAFLFGYAARYLGITSFYLLAGSNAVLGLFNLLPIIPLDGGRALFLCLSCLFNPNAAYFFAAGISVILSVGLIIFALFWYMIRGGGGAFLLSAAALAFTVMQQLGLAKKQSSV